MKRLCICYIIILGICAAVCIAGMKSRERADSSGSVSAPSVASRAVQLMFEYSTPQELNENMSELKTLCTDEVFKNLSIDNEERSLRTYLRFMDNKCAVRITAKTDSYITYSLVSDYVRANQEFIMLYQVDENGLICYVKEAELVNGVDSFAY